MPGQVQVKKGISTDAMNKTIAGQNIPQTSKLFFLIGILGLKKSLLTQLESSALLRPGVWVYPMYVI